MQHAVIDIGSNSMRLTVYQTEDGDFKILFQEKIMAGLAGYVEKGRLSSEGIRRACEGLLEFKNTLTLLGLCQNIHVFATASLRNIINTDEATAKITAATGFPIDIISGQEEALLGYSGILREISAAGGAFVDIGGASTEIAVFTEASVRFSQSYPVGSLKLYKDCVKKILPGKGSVKRIQAAIRHNIPPSVFHGLAPQERLIGTGGTARSLLKFAKHLRLVPQEGNTISREHMQSLQTLLLGEETLAADTILKVAPERIHTIIPGFLILRYLAERFDVRQITVCNYGVREGYLWQKGMTQGSTGTHKTGN